MNLNLRKNSSILDSRTNVEDMLCDAVMANNIKKVQWAVDNGVDVDTEEGWPLEYASEKGYTDIVRLLLDKGARATNVALEKAKARNRTEIVAMLVNVGLNAMDPTHSLYVEIPEDKEI